MVESRKTVAEASTVAMRVHRCEQFISMYVSAVVKDEALADFEASRKEWDLAFAQVPDEALGYLKPGDDYALGGLQVHVNWVLVHYGRVLDGMTANAFAELAPQDRPGEGDAANKKAKAGLTAAERGSSLKEMARLHAAVLVGVRRLR